MWAYFSSMPRAFWTASLLSVILAEPTQLGLISKLAWSAFSPTTQVTDREMLKSTGIETDPLGDTINDWPPPGCRSIDHSPLSTTIQPISYPLRPWHQPHIFNESKTSLGVKRGSKNTKIILFCFALWSRKIFSLDFNNHQLICWTVSF